MKLANPRWLCPLHLLALYDDGHARISFTEEAPPRPRGHLVPKRHYHCPKGHAVATRHARAVTIPDAEPLFQDVA